MVRTVLILCFLGAFTYTGVICAFEGDYIWDERFKTGLKMAAEGAPRDQYALGEMYLKGRGTAKDPAAALAWFLKAAKQGHTRAAYKAGSLLMEGGKGIEAAPKEGFRLLTYSAESGYIPAQYELGMAYANGKMGRHNMSQALQWLGKAKLNGYPEADEAVEEVIRRLVQAQEGRASR